MVRARRGNEDRQGSESKTLNPTGQRREVSSYTSHDFVALRRIVARRGSGSGSEL